MSRIAKLITLILLLLVVSLPITRANHEGDGSGSTHASVGYFVDWVH
ncbi:MAG TPA: hypothetical protein PLZ51_20115 [Aggregatilineales bacterium]|nr:hypothetical protein [Aggregatilineales bacterium]